MVDFDEVLLANSARFRAALAEAPVDAQIPSCPDWTAADLLWHLTEVQHRWASIVEARALTQAEAFRSGSPERPAHRSESLALFDRVSARLAAALSGAPDDEPAWTWATEQSIGWIRRRQAHEALIHRIDAELVAGPPGAIDAAVAEDGVDEVLAKFGAAIPEWGSFDPCGPLVELRAAHAASGWRIRVGRFRGVDGDGTTYDEPDFMPAEVAGSGPVACVMVAPPADLLLWLWGRGPGARLQVEGDFAVVDLVRAAIAANTQ